VALTRHEPSRRQPARARSFLMRFSPFRCTGSTDSGAQDARLFVACVAGGGAMPGVALAKGLKKVLSQSASFNM
jgi:hypothetical protein